MVSGRKCLYGTLVRGCLVGKHACAAACQRTLCPHVCCLAAHACRQEQASARHPPALPATASLSSRWVQFDADTEVEKQPTPWLWGKFMPGLLTFLLIIVGVVMVTRYRHVKAVYFEVIVQPALHRLSPMADAAMFIGGNFFPSRCPRSQVRCLLDTYYTAGLCSSMFPVLYQGEGGVPIHANCPPSLSMPIVAKVNALQCNRLTSSPQG